MRLVESWDVTDFVDWTVPSLRGQVELRGWSTPPVSLRFRLPQRGGLTVGAG